MIEVLHNGTKLNNLISVQLNRSISANCGKWKIETTDDSANPLRPNDDIIIKVDGKPKSIGYIVNVDINAGNDGLKIVASGCDILKDVIDSSVPDNVKVSQFKKAKGSIMKGDDFLGLCEKVITAINSDIKVIPLYNFPMFTAKLEKNQSAEVGQSAMDFLVSFAKEGNVYLNSDQNGGQNLILFRPNLYEFETKLLREKNGQNNNVIKSGMSLSIEDRFRVYKAKSSDFHNQNYNYDVETATTQDQSYIDFWQYKAEDTQERLKLRGKPTIFYKDLWQSKNIPSYRWGGYVDESIRSTRYMDFKSKESLTEAQCTLLAEAKGNIAKAKGIQYKVTVQGHSAVSTIGTEPWDFGSTVPVQDESLGLSGIMLITDVIFKYNLDSGSTTDLICSDTDAYQVEPDKSKLKYLTNQRMLTAVELKEQEKPSIAQDLLI